MTVLAVVCQTARTAWQKQLKQHLTDATAAGTRFIAAWPISILYFCVLLLQSDSVSFEVSIQFWSFVLMTALMQMIATWSLVAALSHAQFAVAVTYSKLEPVFIAILGVSFFSQPLIVLEWLGVIVSMAGIWLLVGAPGRSLKSALLGSLSALTFGIASLSAREASHALVATHMMLAVSMTLMMVLTTQVLIICCYWLLFERTAFKQLQQHWRLAMLVGLAGGVGSIGWFTAFSLHTVALVKVVGQIELFFSVLLTRRFFQEQMLYREYLGVTLVVLSVVLILM